MLFVALKSEPLATEVSRFWRGQTGQDTTLATFVDLNWLGFSYVAFRLIHTLRDRQSGLLPALSLREYVTYVIFAPAYTAGPIDRAERFAEDFRALPEKIGLDGARFTEGFTRIAIGVFKKFVIADSLAMGWRSTPTNATQTHSALGMWLLLYGYALRLYFDFGGYSRRGDWHRHSARHQAAGEFQPPVSAQQYHRFLAKLARDPERLGALVHLLAALALAAQRASPSPRRR